MNRRITCYASVVSEIHQSDIYLTVKARLLETPRANLNGVRVTAAFVDEIINNQSNYVGLPLCADVKNLANGDYQHLGHLYDARTGEFHSAQIGSFYRFEKEDTADGAALIGYARIMKRNKAVCKAISELFADGSLKFSFEISCGSYRELDDGTIEIDADEKNFLEGAAVVSFPACENAVALDLVAECNLLADDTRKGENTMNQETVEAIVSEAEEAVETIVSEENTVEQEAVVAEEAESINASEAPAEQEETKSPVETAETNNGEEDSESSGYVNAEVVVVEEHTSIDSVHMYDTESGESVDERVVHEVTTVTPVNAETEIVSEQNCEDEEPEEEDDEHKEKVAEAAMDYVSMIAELQVTIEELRHEISEIKGSPERIVAETAVSEILNTPNPFIDSDSAMKSKYTLLDSVNDNKLNSYSLLDKA